MYIYITITLLSSCTSKTTAWNKSLKDLSYLVFSTIVESVSQILDILCINIREQIYIYNVCKNKK